MLKLSDTQLVILSAAARRRDRAVLPLPRSLKVKGGAVTKTLEGLRKKGLLDEKPATRIVTAWREGEDGRRMMLAITGAGLRAIGVEADEKTGKQSPSTKPPPKQRRRRAQPKPSGSKPNGRTSPPTVRPGTKQALLIDLLKRKKGATIEEIIAVTGWQAHSVRGAISGALKKKLGLAVTSERVGDRGRVYQIAGSR